MNTRCLQANRVAPPSPIPCAVFLHTLWMDHAYMHVGAPHLTCADIHGTCQVAGRLTRLEREGSKAVLQINYRNTSDDDDDDDDNVSNAPTRVSHQNDVQPDHENSVVTTVRCTRDETQRDAPLVKILKMTVDTSARIPQPLRFVHQINIAAHACTYPHCNRHDWP